MPGITKFYMTLSLLAALLCALEVITPLQLYLNADMILGKLQVRHSLLPPLLPCAASFTG